MRRKMTDKHQLMAYVLSTDADLNAEKNITQNDIAKLFGTSQTAVSQGIKEAKLKIQINELQQELSSIKNELLNMPDIHSLDLPEKIDSDYKRKL